MRFSHFFTILAAQLLLSTATAQSCTSQGPGSCNLGLGGTLYDDDKTKIFWEWVIIYDHFCNEIGVEVNPYQGQLLKSKLPMEVELTSLVFHGDWRSFGMCYGDYCFSGTMACAFEGDEWNNCQHAFPCPGF
ncbi:hypothetical protein SPI_03359 [Niveomyces insectorum RCEF 264]|uniref:Uncharacterized protein n=1 Tax=Niveomyces insectorum RCEF 264 TaxID=1081102 RepID=A0A162J749_9HYPO|nr:hypothetical protein SPI_03359 [Niveomyces insectorum RCEF 264]